MSRLRKAGAIICSAVLCSLVYFANAWAQNDVTEIRYIRALETDDYFDVVNLNGLVFPPRTNSILVLDQPIPGAGTIILVPKGGRLGDPDTMSQEISDPINITLDDRAKRLFLFEPESRELVVIKLGRQLRSPNAIQRFKTDIVGVKDPNGMAVDQKTGTLFILDRFGPKIVQVDPGSNRKNYEGAAAMEEGRISEFILQQDWGGLRGLGFNQTDGCLYVFSTTKQELYRITEDSGLVSVGVLSGYGRIEPEGFVFAPSLDQTDDAGLMHLYIASGGGRSGQVTEWSLIPSGVSHCK